MAGAVNWESYSHEELYRMLWQDADVADVGTVAAEWAQHHVALDTHAQVLREQRVALLDGWHGPAAEEAADRLAALAARVEKIGELAHAGQLAAQEAADALARARAMMPPPPGDQGTTALSAFAPPLPGSFGFAPPPTPALPTAPTFPAFPTAPAFLTALPSAPALSPSSFASMFAPTGTSGMGTAFGAVGGAGFSFYFGAATADQQKAEAIRAMRTYESSLVGGGKLIDGARGAIPPASRTTPANGPAAGGVRPVPIASGPTTGARGGVPWTRLLAGGGAAVGGAAQAAGHGVQLAPGPRAGVLPGAGGVLGVPGVTPAGDHAARGTAQAAMTPPAGSRANGGDDEPHENRMPTIDHGLFTVDDPVSPAVIGQPTGAQP
jgi:hypothetical protein